MQKAPSGEFETTTIFIQLTDCSAKYPMGILQDMLLQVEKFFIPCDFMVMEMDDNAQIPFIIRRPFLVMVGAMIDVKNKKLSL